MKEQFYMKYLQMIWTWITVWSFACGSTVYCLVFEYEQKLENKKTSSPSCLNPPPPQARMGCKHHSWTTGPAGEGGVSQVEEAAGCSAGKRETCGDPVWKEPGILEATVESRREKVHWKLVSVAPVDMKRWMVPFLTTSLGKEIVLPMFNYML